MELKKLPLGLKNPLSDLTSDVKRQKVELFPGSCCSRATVGTDVTLIQHEDEDDAGPTFATVCDGPAANEAVESGFVLAQLKLAVQLFDGDFFYYEGSKIMHSAGTPTNLPAFADIKAPVRSYVVGQTACALLKAVGRLEVKDIKTWKIPREARLKRKFALLDDAKRYS